MPGFPCRPGPCAPGLAGLAYSRQTDGTCGRGRQPKPSAAGTCSWPPLPGCPPPTCSPLPPPSPILRFYSVPTPQPGKQRAESSISPARGGRPQGHANGPRDGQQGHCRAGAGWRSSGFRDGRLWQPLNCTPSFQKHLLPSPGRWASKGRISSKENKPSLC